MLANILPGLRSIRAPLAAGYVVLLAAWLMFSPIIPSSGEATGVTASIYALISAVGKGPALAAVTFIAYVVGVFSVELGTLVFNGMGVLVWVSYSVLTETRKESLRSAARRAFRITPYGTSARMRVEAIEVVVLRRLSARFLEDEQFRDEVTSRLSSLEAQAQEFGSPLPRPLSGESPATLVSDMLDSPETRMLVLKKLVRTGTHAEDLIWESRYLGGDAADLTSLLDERDRHRAEADFRFGLIVPVIILAAVLAYRVGAAWFLVGGGVVAIWLWYMGAMTIVEADKVVLRAVAEEKVAWPAADRLRSTRVYYRDLYQLLRRWPLPAPKPKAADEDNQEAEAGTPTPP